MYFNHKSGASEMPSLCQLGGEVNILVDVNEQNWLKQLANKNGNIREKRRTLHVFKWPSLTILPHFMLRRGLKSSIIGY